MTKITTLDIQLTVALPPAEAIKAFEELCIKTPLIEELIQVEWMDTDFEEVEPED